MREKKSNAVFLPERVVYLLVQKFQCPDAAPIYQSGGLRTAKHKILARSVSCRVNYLAGGRPAKIHSRAFSQPDGKKHATRSTWAAKSLLTLQRAFSQMVAVDGSGRENRGIMACSAALTLCAKRSITPKQKKRDSPTPMRFRRCYRYCHPLRIPRARGTPVREWL